MCILFLLIGDDSSPTVICNNRDEYLARATSRGSLFDNGNIYSPVDQIGGGSWLSFSGLNENKLKFAVVLNFHYWRQPNVMPLTNEEFLKSRGLLIKNFMDSTVCSLDYAQSVFDSRTEYRPFNLIVGDSTGCYYVSRDHRQSAPRLLERGRVYGLSNGYLEDHWQKAATGEAILNNDILPYYQSKLMQSHEHMKPFADCLLKSLLQVDTALEDPDLGSSSEAITTLGAIFVKPCLIFKKKPVVSEASNSSKDDSSSSSSGEVSWDDATIQRLFQMRKDAVLKACRTLPESYVIGSDNDSSVSRDNIFCTRTSTVFVYCPPATLPSSDVVFNVAADRNGLGGHYYIVENDLDATSGEWTTQVFSK